MSKALSPKQSKGEQTQTFLTANGHPNRILSVAPMMDWTDRFDRYFLRLICKHVLLYTEMIHANAIVFGDGERHLQYHASEHPIAIQLGGSDPSMLAQAAKICERYGYDEINLNCGCPSERVQSGSFGACLMATPDLVADCVGAMQDAVSIPVTVKHRLGIDDHMVDRGDDYDFVRDFVEVVSQTGCSSFTVHARKAILKGLSPKENREIPPLNYDRAYALKKDFPHLEFIINGGITNLQETKNHLHHMDGVMIGRAAYTTPYDVLATADRDIYGDDHDILTRDEIALAMIPFIQDCLSGGIPLRMITRHMVGLYHGQHGGRVWRRYLSENAHQDGACEQVVLNALKQVQTTREKMVP